MITCAFKGTTYAAELAGLTTLNAAPILRLQRCTGGGNLKRYTATNQEAARYWLSDHGLKRSKARKLIEAAMRGEEGKLSAGEHGSSSADQQQANR